VQTVILRLRRPALRWVRLVAGVLFIAGAFLSILPLFGIWMLPLGLVLSAEAPGDDDVINKVRTDLDKRGRRRHRGGNCVPGSIALPPEPLADA